MHRNYEGGQTRKIVGVVVAIFLVITSYIIQVHAFETPSNAEINYRVETPSNAVFMGVSPASSGYTMDLSLYKEDREVYWDVAVPVSGSTKYTQYSGYAERVKAVLFNEKPVAHGDSGYVPTITDSKYNWSLDGETVSTVGSYYGSENTRELTILPGDGYYVKRVVISCTAHLVNGYTLLGSPYECGTWEAGNEFNQQLDYTKSGIINIEVPKVTFCHLSNNSPLCTNAYFILIEVAPVPDNLYIEYDYGDISFITNQTDRDIFNNTTSWIIKSNNNSPSDKYIIGTENTQFEYFTSEGLSDDEIAAEAAQWKHFANSISTKATSAVNRAKYKFTGWKAEYYTICDSDYNFSQMLDGEDIIYQNNEEIKLYNHVRLIAQWEESDEIVEAFGELVIDNKGELVIVHITGDSTDIKVVIPSNSEVTIKELPVGDYTLEIESDEF